MGKIEYICKKENLSKVTIIAEAGVNHNGDLGLAKTLIEIAANAGADFAKFQTFKTEALVSKEAKQADYQVKNTGKMEGQYDMLKRLELSHDDHFELIEHCNKNKIKFLSSAFDLESVDFLKTLDLGIWKIPSGEITNYFYLKKIASFNETTILSTGMSTLQEVREAIDLLTASGLEKKNIIVLHCTSDYPTSVQDVNLKAMATIQNELHVQVGYSDHTLGNDVAIGAVALGACLLEKHFTIDKNMSGPDHKASLNPAELKEYVDKVRQISLALGDGNKIPTESELKTRLIGRKSIHLKHDVKNGNALTIDDIEILRPGDGISSLSINNIIGCKVKTSLVKGHKLSISDIDGYKGI